jgi:streptogramin lyase
VWLSDFGSNSMVRFDPVTETFNVYPLRQPGSTSDSCPGEGGGPVGRHS